MQFLFGSSINKNIHKKLLLKHLFAIKKNIKPSQAKKKKVCWISLSLKEKNPAFFFFSEMKVVSTNLERQA